VARNFIFGLSALALMAAAPALAAPATTQARASVAGPDAGFLPESSQSGSSASTAQIQLPADSTLAASAFAFADFGKLNTATSVIFTDYVCDNAA